MENEGSWLLLGLKLFSWVQSINLIFDTLHHDHPFQLRFSIETLSPLAKVLLSFSLDALFSQNNRTYTDVNSYLWFDQL